MKMDLPESFLEGKVEVAYRFPIMGKNGEFGFPHIGGKLMAVRDNGLVLRGLAGEVFIPNENIQYVAQASDIQSASSGDVRALVGKKH